MTRAAIHTRLRLCMKCANYPQCPQSQEVADSETACPLDPPAWGKVGLFTSLLAGQYGDATAVVAKPIARTIDAVAGTNLENCHPCAQRQEAWNLRN